MNIKELLNIFTEDIVDEIITVDNGDGQYILSISDDDKDKNIQINVVLDEEIENAINKLQDDLFIKGGRYYERSN